MYTKGGSATSKHECATKLPSIGSPSYLAVRLYSRVELIGAGSFSDLACSVLQCPTFLHIKPTDVILSLGGLDTGPVVQPLSLPGSSTTPVNIANLSPAIMHIYHQLQGQTESLVKAVVALRKDLAAKSSG